MQTSFSKIIISIILFSCSMITPSNNSSITSYGFKRTYAYGHQAAAADENSILSIVSANKVSTKSYTPSISRSTESSSQRTGEKSPEQLISSMHILSIITKENSSLDRPARSQQLSSQLSQKQKDDIRKLRKRMLK